MTVCVVRFKFVSYLQLNIKQLDPTLHNTLI